MNGEYNKTLIFSAACAGLAFFGVTMLALGPVLSRLGEGANALPATLSAGIIMGTVIFGPVVDRFGYKGLLIAGSVLTLCGIQGLARISAMPLLHLSMLMLGLGAGILNGETNALVSDVYDDKTRGGRLSVLGAFYCVGALLWTLLNYFIKDNYTLPLDLVSALMLAAIVFFVGIRFPRPKPATASVAKTTGLLRHPALILFACLLFFQSGFEGITGNFTIRFLEKTHHAEPAAATLSLTWLTVGMLAGRLPLGALMKKLGGGATLCLYLCIALAGASLLYFSSWGCVYAATALIGWGMGATYPVVFNYLGGAFRELSGTVFSIAIFIGLWGQFTFNKVIGDLFDKDQFGYFPLALALAAAMMLIFLPLAKSKLRK
jgi:fucose permease